MLVDKEACDIAGINFILVFYEFEKNIECKYKVNAFNELPEKIKIIVRQQNHVKEVIFEAQKT